MKFQVGDPVVLKHTGHEGKIISIEQHDMCMVKIGEVVVPVFTENMDHPYFDWFTSDKKKQKNLKNITAEQIPVEHTSAQNNHPQGLFLAFFPIFNKDNDEVIDAFKIYFINQDKERILFKYEARHQDQQLFYIKGDTLAFTNFYIHNVSMDVMHEAPTFKITIGKLTQEIKIRPKKLFQYLQDLINGDIPYYSIPVQDTSWMIVDKDASLPIPKHQQTNIHKYLKNKPVKEIDLHIENLVKDFSHLTNAEIIKIQLDTFKSVFNQAIMLSQPNMTVIHGVGKGTLKDAIHELLRASAEVDFYQNEWSPRYGYGATQIFFKQ